MSESSASKTTAFDAITPNDGRSRQLLHYGAVAELRKHLISNAFRACCGDLGSHTERRKRRETILVVENDSDDVTLLEHMFKKARLLNPVRVVSTVEDAICYLKGEGIYHDRDKYPFPVLVLLDVHLGIGSGYEVIDWVRRDLRDVTMGVVILTGSDIRGIREAYRRGADSFLVKPLKFEDFQNMITGLRGIHLRKMDDDFVVEVESTRPANR